MTTGVYKWSLTAASNDTADTSINWSEGQSPSSVNDSARAMMARIAEWRDDTAGTLTTGGTSTAYTLTSNQGFDTLAHLDGQRLKVRFDSTNGASPTLDVDSLGAKSIKIDTSNAVASGAIRANSVWDVVYDNSNSCFILSSVSLLPAGTVLPYAGSSAPSGYLLCDGSAVSRTTYADLFAIVSTTYGSGDGSTTFNVPDLGGRVIAGKEASASRLTSTYGPDGATLGATGGSQSHTLTSSEMPSHTHTASVTDPGHTHTQDGVNALLANAGAVNGSGYVSPSNSQTGSSTTGISVSNASTGGGGAHTSVQPTIVLNYIIKT